MTFTKYERKRILIKSENIDFGQFHNKDLSEFIDYFINLRESYKNEFSYEPSVSIFNNEYEFKLNVYRDEPDEDYKARIVELDNIRKNLEKERRVRKKYKRINPG